jgi:cytochrome c oxidase cbb3-type subunit 4
MDFEALYRFVGSLWVVWLMALFIAMVVWVFWPSRKARLEKHGRIPLKDDEQGE